MLPLTGVATGASVGLSDGSFDELFVVLPDCVPLSDESEPEGLTGVVGKVRLYLKEIKLDERAEFCHVAQQLDDTSSNVDLDVTVFGARDRRRDCEVAQAKS